jgi:hypothetical protein
VREFGRPRNEENGALSFVRRRVLAPMAHVEERNQDATVWCGDLEKQVDEALLWELFLQCGPIGMLFFASCSLNRVTLS